MAWKKMQVRGPNARYACVEKFRAITINEYGYLYKILLMGMNEYMSNKSKRIGYI
jgi:hypothetical protein